MKNLIIRLLLTCQLALIFTGCATSQLYEGQPRPKSEIVTVKHPWVMTMKAFIGGKWITLDNGSTVLPGKYKVTVLCNAVITGSSGASGMLESAGFNHYGFAEVPDSFSASAGDTVTYFWSGGEKTGFYPNGLTYHCTGFDHTVLKLGNHTVDLMDNQATSNSSAISDQEREAIIRSLQEKRRHEENQGNSP